MRNFSLSVTALLLSLFLSASLYAQPQISYIIPDIGAAGMSTYVEIIAPENVNGSFGTDGFYLNNPGDAFRVEGSGPRANDVVVGPVVVSWNGRLISTHVFVKPGVGVGTIPLRVTTPSGNATVDFEIVNPGTINNPAPGPLGPRSKRGAMIVNSVTLNSGSYTVNTSDPDNGASGNQGFLPFILISKGPVTIEPGVTIDVSANNRDGGPGGGGGGGQMCDRTFLGNPGNGQDGGSGYTGGGAGGQNYSGGSSFQSPGTGSGAGGNSLNSAAGGANNGCYEGTGGGTGHPFGEGGIGWCGSGSPDGRFGGASTAGQNGAGGGAGYSLDGANGSGSGASNNRGRLHGNAQLVPFAGGSGGAGGNPQELGGGCGGTGGGGGGAIAIYSMERMTNRGKLVADGANGSDGSRSSDGGGGSGGGIVIGAKIGTVGGGLHTVAGGTGSGSGGDGSIGRVRYDGFPTSAPSFGAIQPYIGVTTDTTSFSTTSTFTLRGTYGGSTQLRVYMRGDNTNWQEVSGVSPSGRNWSVDVTTPGVGNYYFAAFQEVTGSNSNQRTAVPSWVTSQVAANIVKVASAPKIDTVGGWNGSFGNPGPCPEPVEQVVFRFKSTGTDPLNVRAVISGAAPGVFSIIDPPGISNVGGLNYDPDIGKEITITVRANYRVGTSIDTLWIYTNDPRNGYDAIGPILLTVFRESAGVTVGRDTVDFGQVCVGERKDDTVRVHFNGTVVQHNVDLVNALRSPFFQTPRVSTPLLFVNPDIGQQFDSTVRIPVRFVPSAVGVYIDSIEVSDICGKRMVYLRGEGFKVDVTILPGANINLGSVPVGNSVDTVICFRNNGTDPVTIRSGMLVPSNSRFTILSPPNLSNQVINPGDSIKVRVEFTPDSIGSFDVRLQIQPDGPCNAVPTIFLSGFGVDVCLEAGLDSILFVADSCSVSPDPLERVVNLRNCGGIDVALENIYTANNKVTSTIANNFPYVLGTLPSSRSTSMTVTWVPPVAGSGIDTVFVVWRDTKRNAFDTIRIPITMQFDRAVVELQTVAGDTVPSILDIGGVYQCGPASDTLVLVNAGTVEGEITGDFTNGGLFTVDPPLPFHLEVGESKRIVVSIDPSKAPDVGTTYQDELTLRNGKCDQEWKIALLSTRYELTVDVNGVNFGGTNLNLPRTRTVQFTNTTNAPPTENLVIGSVYVDPPSASPPFEIVDPTLFPTTVLADSGRFNFDVSFTPAAEQLYNGRLCFQIVEPCDTVICVDMSGEGIRSNIYVPQGNLDFGGVYFCAEDTMALTVYSVGPVPLRVDDIQVVGGDMIAFEVISISETLSHTMRPGFPTIQDSINVLVRFRPGLVPPDGVKNSTLEIRSNDSAQPVLMIPLTGERTSPTVVGPGLVNYGTVVVNAAGVQNITLTNTSNDEIEIAGPVLASNSPFQVVSPLPIRVPAGESVDIQVEFRPSDSQVYNDTLVGTFILPCDGEVRVPLTGEGLRGATVITIPTTIVGEPGQVVSIPIVLQEAESIAEVGATTFEAWIRFNASMLLPTELQFAGTGPKRTAASGQIVENIIDGEDRVLKVRITNDPLPAAPDTLGSIDAVVLLGDALTTPVSFDSLKWVDGEVATTLTDGEFALEGYCDVGSNRLVRIEGGFGIKAVTPNPVESTTEIRFETVENGPTTLEVYDIHGKKISTLLDVPDLPVQAHIVHWNAEEISAGVYYAVLLTPTQRSIKRLVLVR